MKLIISHTLKNLSYLPHPGKLDKIVPCLSSVCQQVAPRVNFKPCVWQALGEHYFVGCQRQVKSLFPTTASPQPWWENSQASHQCTLHATLLWQACVMLEGARQEENLAAPPGRLMFWAVGGRVGQVNKGRVERIEGSGSKIKSTAGSGKAFQVKGMSFTGQVIWCERSRKCFQRRSSE